MKLRPSWLAVWLAALFVWLIALAAAWLFHWSVWVHFALLGTGFTHAVLGWAMACREERRKRRDGCPICGDPLDEHGHCAHCGFPSIHTGGIPPPPPDGCPICGGPVDEFGNCQKCGFPDTRLGGTILLCPHCGNPLREGECPNGCEECPTCGALLMNGACPNGHAILRCSICGVILRDGECPHGHGAWLLTLGWSGEEPPPMSPFSLEVVEAPVSHRHDRCALPATVVIGRDFREATGAYVQLCFPNPEQGKSCSRTYVQLSFLADKNAMRVTLMAAANFAVVDGRRLSRKGDAAEMSEGGVLELNPGYRLRLVRTASETETPSA